MPWPVPEWLRVMMCLGAYVRVCMYVRDAVRE